MQTKQLAELCAEANTIVQQAAQFIKAAIGKVSQQEIETKALNSLVSYVDKGAEEILVEQLSKLLPQATFLTEEETVQQEQGDLQWIIDPLDGTTNFLHELPFFSVSVALQRREQTLLGIVHEVNRDEQFYAWKGGGASLNGEPIRVTPNTQLSEGGAGNRLSLL